jgi:hypothetical protein
MLYPFDSSRGNWKTNVGFSHCARRSRKCEYPIMLRRRDNDGDHAPYVKEGRAREQLQVGTSVSRASTPLHGYDSLHHQQHTLDSFDLVQDPATYPEFASRLHPYSSRTPSPLSSSFLPSYTGSTTSSVKLLGNTDVIITPRADGAQP